MGYRHEQGEISVEWDENCPCEQKLRELGWLAEIKQLRVTSKRVQVNGGILGGYKES